MGLIGDLTAPVPTLSKDVWAGAGTDGETATDAEAELLLIASQGTI